MFWSRPTLGMMLRPSARIQIMIHSLLRIVAVIVGTLATVAVGFIVFMYFSPDRAMTRYPASPLPMEGSLLRLWRLMAGLHLRWDTKSSSPARTCRLAEHGLLVSTML